MLAQYRLDRRYAIRRNLSEVRYYLGSLRLGVKQFARTVRGHWSIENTLAGLTLVSKKNAAGRGKALWVAYS